MTTDQAIVEGVDAPVLDIDPYSLEVLENPYPFHEKLRETAPVVRIKPYDVYAVGRHEEARVVLSDYKRFSTAAGIGIQDIRKPGLYRVPSKLLEVDPPAHTKVRAALTKVLTPLVIRQWRQKFETEAERVVAAALAKGEVDGVSELAENYVFTVFPQAIGVTLPRKEILAIGEMRFNQSGPANELYHAAMARAQPYLAWFENSCERSAVQPGSIGDLVFEQEAAGAIEAGVASNIIRSFVGGGTDSTISGIGFALNQLARNPDQWAVAKADPARIKSALDEAIRYEAPFQVTYRTTTGPVELGGVRLDPQTKVGVFLGAANRDPRKWQQPDKFDLTRQTAGVHLAFGTADHVCIGQMLARLEAECLLAALVKGLKSIEPAGEPKYRLINQMRTLDHLPLRLVGA